MRIGSGKLRGRKLKAPRGLATRPLLARIRKSLCDTLAGRFAGARVLDIYAGSGSFGIEALSRGAALAVLVESDPEAVGAIQANLAGMSAGDGAVLEAGDAESALSSMVAKGEEFDIIFLDPPFRAFEAGIVEMAAGLLAEGGVMALRTRRGTEVSLRLGGAFRVRVKNYGISQVSFYERKAAT